MMALTKNLPFLVIFLSAGKTVTDALPFSKINFPVICKKGGSINERIL